MSKIMNWFLLPLATAFSMASFDAKAWDFSFSYTNIFEPNALNYVVEQYNIQRKDEGTGPGFDLSYWCPITNGVEARLTQRFTFARQTASIFLTTKIESFNFGGGEFGNGSLWGSANGEDWVLLMDAPTTSSTSSSYWFKTNLPNSLIGASEVWIQTRLNTTGWNILAQHCRSYNYSETNTVFELDASFSADQIKFVKAFTIDFQNLLIGSNYVLQASSNLVDWSNWAEPFTATNSAYTNSNYQRIDNWSGLFFRLKSE
jgi:hypothetical protein